MSRIGNRLPALGAGAVGVAIAFAVINWPRPRSPAVLDPSVRETLARDLRSRPDKAATDAILALLTDDAPEVRLAAAESLEARADRHSLIPIAARVEDEEDLDVEGALRRALGKMTAER